MQQATGAERRKYKYRHTGIIASAGPDTLQTIEGNTNDDGSAEGYEVCARTRGYTNMDFIVFARCHTTLIRRCEWSSHS